MIKVSITNFDCDFFYPASSREYQSMSFLHSQFLEVLERRFSCPVFEENSEVRDAMPRLLGKIDDVNVVFQICLHKPQDLAELSGTQSGTLCVLLSWIVDDNALDKPLHKASANVIYQGRTRRNVVRKEATQGPSKMPKDEVRLRILHDSHRRQIWTRHSLPRTLLNVDNQQFRLGGQVKLPH